jgi:VanZ family protein
MKATVYGLRWAVVLLSAYWLLLFIGTHLPPNQVMSQIRANDKLLHASAFAGLSFLVAWAIPTKRNRWINVFAAIAVCVAYAAVDELLQIPVGRTADWLDFAADLLGIVMGISIYVLGRAMIIAAGWTIFEPETPVPLDPELDT